MEVNVNPNRYGQKIRSKQIWELVSNLANPNSDIQDIYGVRITTDLDECQAIWQAVIPGEHITDLWEVRSCFQQHYMRPLNFIVVEDDQGICGLLPLSLIEELRCYGYFPGEIWHGKTWLEQNRIYHRNGGPQALLSCCNLPYHLNYLAVPESQTDGDLVVDEIGYLFSPPQYDYDIQNYFTEFSHKSIKQILREVAALESRGVSYRYDDLADFELMIQLNISRFGTNSYFYDRRFRESFRRLANFLHDKGWLRFTTVSIGHEPAAVDMGCLYKGEYTLLAGGTNPRFPGVAKLINLHHIQRACNERMHQVDFLCGDFNWKKLFHLSPRPLFMLSNLSSVVPQPTISRANLHTVNG
jgi:hypothetical protein